MVTNVTSGRPVAGRPAHFGRKTVIAAIGCAFLLAAVAGVALVSRGGDESAKQPASVAVAPGANPGTSSLSGAVGVVSPPAPKYIYIVGSAEQASMVSSGVAEGNAILAALGEPLTKSAVIVAQSDAEEAAAIQSINEGNAILQALGLGLPLDVIVDLRQ